MAGKIELFWECSRFSVIFKGSRRTIMPNGERVAASPRDVCPLLNGIRIPPVTLRAADGTAFDLGGAVKTKPAVLVFYRGGW